MFAGDAELRDEAWTLKQEKNLVPEWNINNRPRLLDTEVKGKRNYDTAKGITENQG